MVDLRDKHGPDYYRNLQAMRKTKAGIQNHSPKKRKEIAASGGSVKGKKGLASLSPERRKEISSMGIEAREDKDRSS